jgi:hypothetical protein
MGAVSRFVLSVIQSSKSLVIDKVYPIVGHYYAIGDRGVLAHAGR